MSTKNAHRSWATHCHRCSAPDLLAPNRHDGVANKGDSALSGSLRILCTGRNRFWNAADRSLGITPTAYGAPAEIPSSRCAGCSGRSTWGSPTPSCYCCCWRWLYPSPSGGSSGRWWCWWKRRRNWVRRSWRDWRRDCSCLAGCGPSCKPVSIQCGALRLQLQIKHRIFC